MSAHQNTSFAAYTGYSPRPTRPTWSPELGATRGQRESSAESWEADEVETRWRRRENVDGESSADVKVSPSLLRDLLHVLDVNKKQNAPVQPNRPPPPPPPPSGAAQLPTPPLQQPPPPPKHPYHIHHFSAHAAALAAVGEAAREVLLSEGGEEEEDLYAPAPPAVQRVERRESLKRGLDDIAERSVEVCGSVGEEEGRRRTAAAVALDRAGWYWDSYLTTVSEEKRLRKRRLDTMRLANFWHEARSEFDCERANARLHEDTRAAVLAFTEVAKDLLNEL
ncbi:hypothetical protein JCM10213_003347 [Rhodosporidiobolus nylandii]